MYLLYTHNLTILINFLLQLNVHGYHYQDQYEKYNYFNSSIIFLMAMIQIFIDY